MKITRFGMSFWRQLSIGWKASGELGFQRLVLYALYQLGIKFGWFRCRLQPDRKTKTSQKPVSLLQPVISVPPAGELASLLEQEGLADLHAEAEELVRGQVRLFGGEPVALNLVPTDPLHHWTRFKDDRTAGSTKPQEDIRWKWEHARFGWAFCLGRAYHVSGDERYSQAFWEHTERFLTANPPYYGEHWVSAQEAALRIIAMVFAWHIFRDSPQTTHSRTEQLSLAIAQHAERIPSTMIYARAQNNNHLLSEAAGLFTAALALPEHPQASDWRRMGWLWFNRGLRDQITPEGVYCQHSANYQRFMLQLALWMGFLITTQGDKFPDESIERLRAATRWLLTLCDLRSGRAPNLGPNDGSHILPMSGCLPEDYRPALQAASLAFDNQPAFPSGIWDEEALWLGLANRSMTTDLSIGQNINTRQYISTPTVLRIPQFGSWAYLRCASFNSRPGHADQLHLDIWWQSRNIAQDAGTYLYNAARPWDNSLAGTRVHNTLTVGGQDQMDRAGRFLWQNWAQGRILGGQRMDDGSWESLAVAHNGYRRLGVEHRRTVTAHRDGRWEIVDQVIGIRKRDIPGLKVEVHWLLPDWQWELIEQDTHCMEIHVKSPLGPIGLKFSLDQVDSVSQEENRLALGVTRAGELLAGEGEISPNWGWVSPTYGYLEPALSIRVGLCCIPPITIRSVWRLGSPLD